MIKACHCPGPPHTRSLHRIEHEGAILKGCSSCDGYLPFGPATITPEVEIEIAAAEVAAHDRPLPSVHGRNILECERRGPCAIQALYERIKHHDYFTDPDVTAPPVATNEARVR